MKTSLFRHTAAMLVLLAAFSCKKDSDTTETKPYMYGLDFNLPTFASIGDSFTVNAFGIYTTEGNGVSIPVYKWKLGDGEFKTTDSFTFTVTAVGNYTVTCQASDPDDNYYATSTSKTLVVIDPALGETLTGTGILASDEHIIDPRDKARENAYYVTTIGGRDWFRNNLAYTGAGIAYERTDVTSYPLGRYYTWDEAMTACPDGWRLPTLEEWKSLGDEAGPLLCDAYFNGEQMWEFWPAVNKTNELNMAVIPSGYALSATSTPVFKRIYEYAAFWTATQSEEDSRMAAYRYIYEEENEIRTTYGDKASLALSVRCVR